MNWAFWDGKVSQHWYREEHPLDTQTSKTVTPTELGEKSISGRPEESREGEA